MRRSTPTGRLVSSGRRAYHSNRWTRPETKGQRQLRRLCPRCLLRRARSNPLRQHSLVGDRGRANHPRGHARATGIAHPGFYGRKPWSKAKQCAHYHRSRHRKRGPARPPRQIAAKSFTKVHNEAPDPDARLPPQQAEGQPPQKLPPSPRSPRVVERGPAPTGLPVPLEAPHRVRLRGKRHAVVFEQGQLHRQQPLLGRQPLEVPAPVGVCGLQLPLPGDEGPGVPDHVCVVVGRLPRHEVGVLPPLPGP